MDVEAKIALEHRLSVVEDRSKSNQHRLDEVEKRQEDMTELVQSVATTAQKQVDMDGDVQEIKKDVKGILEMPRKRLNAGIDGAIKGGVGALIGALMALVLK